MQKGTHECKEIEISGIDSHNGTAEIKFSSYCHIDLTKNSFHFVKVKEQLRSNIILFFKDPQKQSSGAGIKGMSF